jgi:type VI secretion system protein VasD
MIDLPPAAAPDLAVPLADALSDTRGLRQAGGRILSRRTKADVTVASRRVSSALALALAGLLAACGGAPLPPPPTVVELVVHAAEDVNPDPTGRPSPIVLHYYQLGGTAAFEKADYFQIHDKEAALLGADLLDRQDLPLTPGASQSVSFEAKPGTKSLGIIASYRDIDKAVWRAALPLPAQQKTKVMVQLNKLGLSVAPDNTK